MPDKITKIYEIIDNTSDELYLIMGIFLTLDSAIAELQDTASKSDDHPITESGNDYDYESIEIRERKTGWSSDRKVVYTMRRALIWKNDDETVWEIEAQGKR